MYIAKCWFIHDYPCSEILKGNSPGLRDVLSWDEKVDRSRPKGRTKGQGAPANKALKSKYRVCCTPSTVQYSSAVWGDLAL